MFDEEWKDIIIDNVRPIYQVSNTGKIRNKLTGKHIKAQLRHTGYLFVGLSYTMPNGKTRGKSFAVHRLVATMFVSGKTDENCSVDHVDCDKLNNNYTNLEWVSMSENSKRAHRNGLFRHVYGTDVGSNVLSEEEVIEICELLVKYRGAVAKIMWKLPKHIGIHLVYQIKNKKTWSWISDNYFYYGQFDDMKRADIELICETLVKLNGKIAETLKAVSDKIPDVNYSMIKEIKRKKHWTEISDEYFDDDYFELQEEITEEEAHMICDSLVKYNGSIKDTYNALKDVIPLLTVARINNIKQKNHGTWCRVSDMYFDKDTFR